MRPGSDPLQGLAGNAPAACMGPPPIGTVGVIPSSGERRTDLPLISTIGRRPGPAGGLQSGRRSGAGQASERRPGTMCATWARTCRGVAQRWRSCFGGHKDRSGVRSAAPATTGRAAKAPIIVRFERSSARSVRRPQATGDQMLAEKVAGSTSRWNPRPILFMSSSAKIRSDTRSISARLSYSHIST